MNFTRSWMAASAFARAVEDVMALASRRKDSSTVCSSSTRLKLEHFCLTPLQCEVSASRAECKRMHRCNIWRSAESFISIACSMTN